MKGRLLRKGIKNELNTAIASAEVLKWILLCDLV